MNLLMSLYGEIDHLYDEGIVGLFLFVERGMGNFKNSVYLRVWSNRERPRACSVGRNNYTSAK